MAKINKYMYGWKFYIYYGPEYGWEYEIFEETFKGMKENKKAYLENCPYPLKISKGRELNPTWCKLNNVEYK